jgi:hypothetical protein
VFAALQNRGIRVNAWSGTTFGVEFFIDQQERKISMKSTPMSIMKTFFQTT